MTLSGPLFGFLADRYGRKCIIGFTLLSSSVIGVAIFIFRSYIAYVILRFFLGFVLQVGYVLNLLYIIIKVNLTTIPTNNLTTIHVLNISILVYHIYIYILLSP